MSMNLGPETVQYTVQAGDTLWELANEYDTTIEDIMASNPGIDPDDLQVGQLIFIPDAELSVQQRPGRRPGRRPYRRRPPYRPYYRPYPYRPYYPYAGACPAGGSPYITQPGDNLYNIAAQFGVSVDSIIALNPYVNFGLALPVGQLICIPV
jgi:peptidoglycan endopeptidase LytF